MRHISWVAIFGVLVAVAACDSQTGNNSPPNGTGSGKDCRWVGDPDKGGIVRVCDDIWDCQDLPNAEKKCVSPNPQSPDGLGGWTCRHDGEHLICEKGGDAIEGGGSWVCTVDAEGVKRCEGAGGENGAPGGGSWVCVTDKDGKTTVCTSSSDGDVPPGGGSWNCTVDKELTSLTCEEDTTQPPPTGGGGSEPTIGGGLAGGGTPCMCPKASGSNNLPSDEPFGIVKTAKVTANGVTALKARIYYSKLFCDNTYGVNAIGWDGSKKGGHQFKDLVGSDKQVVYFHNCDGDTVLTVQLDYISEDTSRPSGYGSLGVDGGDGKMLSGDRSDVLAFTSSLDVNFNTLGHVLTQDSPAADNNYNVQDPKYADWIFDMYYEVVVRWSAFGASGPCRVSLAALHASPSKTDTNELDLEPCPCK